VRIGGEEFVAVTFLDGKVIPTIGSYTLHLPRTHPLSSTILQLTQINRHFIFLEESQTSLMAVATIGRALRCIRPVLEAKSIRRGGLMQMAARGATKDQILHMSKHKTPGMLMKYLCSGIWALEDAKISSKTANVVGCKSQH
jgi:hypothetical protein